MKTRSSFDNGESQTEVLDDETIRVQQEQLSDLRQRLIEANDALWDAFVSTMSQPTGMPSADVPGDPGESDAKDTGSIAIR